MCSQHCCGDSESEKQTENQREAPGCPSTSLADIAASKSFQLCLLYASVCASESLSAQEQNMSCMIVQVYEITTLVAGPYFKSCDSWSAPAYADLLG